MEGWGSTGGPDTIQRYSRETKGEGLGSAIYNMVYSAFADAKPLSHVSDIRTGANGTRWRRAACVAWKEINREDRAEKQGKRDWSSGDATQGPTRNVHTGTVYFLRPANIDSKHIQTSMQ